MPSRVRGLVVACALLASRIALAQDIAAAEELYRRGIADFRAERLDAACQEFAASYRIDPHPGVLFTLATCEARLGRIATAAARYDDFLRLVAALPPEQQAVQAERREAAVRERAALAPQIPRLTVVLPLPEGAPANATVRRDGTALDATSLGQSLPVDPGEHVVTVEVGGVRGDEQRVVVSKGETKTVTLRLPPTPAPSPAPSPSAVEPPAPRAAILPAPADERGATPARGPSPWLYVTGVLGVAGVATGATAGGLAMEDKSIVDLECKGQACSARGSEAADRGKTEALVSTVAFGVGAAALAATIILYVVDRAQSHAAHAPVAPSRWLGSTSNTVFVGGSF